MREFVHLKVPATTANLGPGFDALGLALSLFLEIEAYRAEAFSISATGRNADLCGELKGNLIIETYCSVLHEAGKNVVPLRLIVKNEIPLGKGCGSSAAAIVAGVLLADLFGELNWSESRRLQEVSRIEGHPDNVAACLLGGLVISSMDATNGVTAVRSPMGVDWRFYLAIPDEALSTEKARGLLPEMYSKADAILNVQHAAMLVAAFALGQGSLLKTAMADRMHQPYRIGACPLLQTLLPLAGDNGILGVALSGAGPSVLLIADAETVFTQIQDLMEKLKISSEIIEVHPSGGATLGNGLPRIT